MSCSAPTDHGRFRRKITSLCGACDAPVRRGHPTSGQVEEKRLGVLLADQREGALAADGGAVARPQRLAVEGERAACQMQPRVPAGRERVDDLLVSTEERRVDARV